LVQNPFNHPRLIIHQFEVAQALMRHGIERVSNRLRLVNPAIVVHPLRAIVATGLTDVEERALRECALSAGGRFVIVHVGAELRPEEAIALTLGAA
jgi:rod shape-determining protein MreB